MKNKLEVCYDYVKSRYDEIYKINESIRNRASLLFSVFSTLIVAFITLTINQIDIEDINLLSLIDLIEFDLIKISIGLYILSLIYFCFIIKPKPRSVNKLDEVIKHLDTLDVSLDGQKKKEKEEINLEQALYDVSSYINEDLDNLRKFNDVATKNFLKMMILLFISLISIIISLGVNMIL